jgi:hypothetical protein
MDAGLRNLNGMRAITRLFDDVYRTTTSDYFRKLGGLGQYDSYEEWHSLALTLLIGLRSFELADQSRIGDCLMILPREIHFGCDNIAAEVEKQFGRKNLTLEGDQKLKTLEGLADFWSHMTKNCKGFRFSDFDEHLRSLLGGSSN